MNIESVLAHLLEIQGKLPLAEVDETYKLALKRFPNHLPLAFSYNEFRVSHAAHLPKTRPHILVGGALASQYFNLHHMHLCQIADVVCLTGFASPYQLSSVLPCTPTDLFPDILKRLPKGFKPDFYWDNQVEHQHLIPPGIESAPFPIVASVCHTFLHKSIEQICELFDLVLPLSHFHASLLKKKYGAKILEVPFGLNWAAPTYIGPLWKKSLDVCVTFTDHDSPAYAERRRVVLDLIRRFKDKYGDRFSLEILSNLDYPEYVEMLQKSRITLNVSGVHGPYNYRTTEAMQAGSMVFQYDWENDFFENKFSELFVEGMHGAGFTAETFEKKLLHYLENPSLTEKIAREAYAYLNKNYSYKKLYKYLIKHVCMPVPRRFSKYEGYHRVSLIYYNQNNELAPLINYETLYAFDHPNWIKQNNLMVLSCDLEEESLGFELLSSLESGNRVALARTFYQAALASCPEPYTWIVKWNFLLISLQLNQAGRLEIQEMITLLETLDPEPFDERNLLFKYFLQSPDYPLYNLAPNAVDSVHPFTQLNIDLMKCTDNPKERARLHKNYALNASKAFL